MALRATSGLGWNLSLPDYRDYSPDSPVVREMLARLKQASSAAADGPQDVSLREYFPAVDDQQYIHSSTAHACVDLVRYFERRVHGRTAALSKLFLYKVTRKLLGVSGDTGADLRSTLKAIVLFGIPGTRHWPDDAERFDAEPDAFLYALADRYRSVRYVRLDGRNRAGAETLAVVKSFLAAGFPAVFGFAVPESISRSVDVPYRPTFDSVHSGQAGLAIGYDDRRLGSTRGALLFRYSWGSDWGEDGYGWLPYAYVEQQLAADFWTLLSAEWLESGEFQRPQLPAGIRNGPSRMP